MTHTLTQVLDTLDAVVADFGADYVQEQCVYRSAPEREHDGFGFYGPEVPGTGGEPVCIVAQVLARIAPDLLPVVENNSTWESQADEIMGQFEPAANLALRRAQEAQDGRAETGYQNAPWGEAVAFAKEAVA